MAHSAVLHSGRCRPRHIHCAGLSHQICYNNHVNSLAGRSGFWIWQRVPQYSFRFPLTALILISLAVAAVAAPPVVASGSRASLSQAAWRSPGPAFHDSFRADGQMDGTEGYPAMWNSQRRRLQTQLGQHTLRANHPCPRCRFWQVVNGIKQGHCRSGGHLFNCSQRVSTLQSPAFFAAEGSVVDASVRTNASDAAPSGEVFAVLQIPEGNSTAIVAGVGCFRDSDCALPSSGFEPINGSAPASDGGILAAECDRGGGEGDTALAADEPGVCFCTYTVAAAGRDSGSRVSGTSATTAARVSTTTRGRRGSIGNTSASRRPDFRAGGSAASQEVAVSQSLEILSDLCIRRSGFENVSIVNDSEGGLTLVNTTASGNVSVGIGFGETNETMLNVSTDFVLSDDSGLVSMASGMPEEDEADEGETASSGRAAATATATGGQGGTEEVDVAMRIMNA